MQTCFHLGEMEMNLIRTWCLMQVHIVKQMPSVKAGYVDPQPIAQTNFNYPKRWTLDAKELAAAKTLREKEHIRTAKLTEESLKVAAYIALALKNLQQHSTIWLPYNFDNHWICIAVDVGRSMAWVFDSSDKDTMTYKDFISILKTFYVTNHHGRHDPARKEKLAIKTLCACPKQKPGSVRYGYYICSMMSNTGAYRRHPLRISLNLFTRSIKTSYMV
ncbi:uncharacterized protein [Miscanthus floridulus]|uniref:uncharacterized protein n=1 Tax=Miscanthus floridulus TaxID=154761 RepID=UPI00345893EA